MCTTLTVLVGHRRLSERDGAAVGAGHARAARVTCRARGHALQPDVVAAHRPRHARLAARHARLAGGVVGRGGRGGGEAQAPVVQLVAPGAGHRVAPAALHPLPTTTRKKQVFLFNDALNTFYLRLYGVGHIVKDHSDSERGDLLLPHRLLFPINSKGSLICIIPQTG